MMNEERHQIRIVVLADVPVWTLPGLGHLRRSGTYATWLEGLIPHFENIADLDMHWVCVSKETGDDLLHQAFGQTFHILRRGKKSISMLTRYWSERRRITKLVKRLQPDVLHAWGTEDVFGLAGSGIRMRAKLFTLQGCLQACLEVLDRPPWLMRVQALYESSTVQAFRVATGESPGALEHLKRMNPGMTTHWVDCGVPREFFDVEWTPSVDPEIIFVGSVTEAKGIRDLCDVMRDPGMQHVTLKVVGDGDLRDALRGGGADNVEWLGRLDRGDLIGKLRKSWALVIPTYSDTGPSVLKEARVVGLPVITTKEAGASCYIENEASGYVIDAGDHDGLRTAISSLCGSRDHCLSLGRHGWSGLREKLDQRVAVRRYAELYRDLAREDRREA